jgi:hypothetical protein
MAIRESKTIFTDSGVGWVDRYATLVKGYTDFGCGCGQKIRVSYRKEFRGTDPYRFVIKHRNREKVYTTMYPDELGVYDRMLKVATYAHCSFPKKKNAYR